MARVSRTCFVGASLWLVANASMAMGFGAVGNSTLLGQPLNFMAIVRLQPDESLERECASAEVSSGENRIPPSQVRVIVEPGADAGQRVVRVSTITPIDEPVVTVVVTLGCGAVMSRQFVSFVDPPVIQLAQSASPTDAASSASVRDPADAAQGASAANAAESVSVAAERAASAVAPSATAPPARRSDVIVSAPRRASPAASVARLAAPPARPAAGSRLRLETAPPVAATEPRSPGVRDPLFAAPPPQVAAAPPQVAAPPPTAVAALESMAPASGASAAGNAAEAERLRILALEDSVQRLRVESEATRKAMLAMQSSLQDAQNARYNNPLIFVLGLLCALLAALLVMGARRRSRPAERPEWWDESMPPQRAVERSSGGTLGSAHASDAPDSVPAGVEIEGTPSTHGAREPRGFEDTFPAEPDVVVMPASTAAARLPVRAWAAAPSPVSIDPLIDLAQQAEFFVVLGQEDSAVDLWSRHLHKAGGQSPLPYLELLELHQRMGNQSAFEAVRDDFTQRFGAMAASELSARRPGHWLEDHPETVRQLQRDWVDSARAMQTLEAAILHRDTQRVPFDLPAYRDMLFLYAVARDHAEHDGAAGAASAVDLLLPLDAAGAPSALPFAVPYARASTALEPFTLDIDIDMDLSATAIGPGRAADSAEAGLDHSATPSGFFDLDDDPVDAKAPRRG